MSKTNNGSINEVILTPEGIRKLENELDELKSVKRQEVAERIKTAISFGDISENAEYDEAKNEQAFIEGKIIKIENTLRMAKVIDEDDINTDFVNIGNTVKIYDEEFNEEVTYTIVGSAEADPSNNKISNESPVGRALIGSTIGQVVVAHAPYGSMKLKVLAIQ
ncbi:MAG: transcription elongation factor GreA [Christensenellales bacterium]